MQWPPFQLRKTPAPSATSKAAPAAIIVRKIGTQPEIEAKWIGRRKFYDKLRYHPFAKDQRPLQAKCENTG
jgi:hypothetical protein